MEAAFFDLDKTVIARASMVAFGRPLLKAGMISRWLLVRALWSNLVFHYMGADEETMRKFRESALRITRGWDQTHIRTLVRDNLTEVIEPIVYEEALELIRQHQIEGRRVFIVSASPIEIVEPLGAYLGVDEAIATRAEIDENGRYTGRVDFYSYGPAKVEAMREIAEREQIDLAKSYAYSDSATDLPMLEAVGHPVVVNPDRDLARVARDRDWEIRLFHRSVPLRERVAMPAPRYVVALGAGVAAVAVGLGALWWWTQRGTEPPPTCRQQVAKRVRSAGRNVSASVTTRTSWFRSPAASSPRMRRGRARRR